MASACVSTVCFSASFSCFLCKARNSFRDLPSRRKKTELENEDVWRKVEIRLDLLVVYIQVYLRRRFGGVIPPVRNPDKRSSLCCAHGRKNRLRTPRAPRLSFFLKTNNRVDYTIDRWRRTVYLSVTARVSVCGKIFLLPVFQFLVS